MPWLVDGTTKWERIAVDHLRAISSIDLEVSALILGYPWVLDGIAPRESSAIVGIRGIMDEDPDLGNSVLNLWWVGDDMPTVEAYAITNLRDLARKNLALTWQTIAQPFMGPPFRYRDQYALQVLAELASDTPEDQALLAQLSSQPWFSDGLDDLDAATLYLIGATPDGVRRALVETHYVTSVPITLPLSGAVEFVIVRHTPFPPDDHTIATMEESLVVIERFMGAPFPVSDFILLIVDQNLWNVGGKRVSGISGGSGEPGHVVAYIVVGDSESGPARRNIYHEIAHYYHLYGPRWLVEGTANFLEAYVLDWTGAEKIDDRSEYLELNSACRKENIQQHIDNRGQPQCDYDLGEQFLYAMYRALGSEVTSAALRDLHAQSLLNVYLSEDTIFHAFRSNAPREVMEAFEVAYRRYHGGASVDAVLEDSPDLPSLAALYEKTNGERWLKNDSWMTESPLGTWQGVITSPDGRVWEVNLDENSLTGQIPAELGSLSYLQNLFLARNSLTGEIPASLGNLSELRWLNIGGNQLSGEIPPELGSLSGLWALGLWENRLSGTIPAELGQLDSLVSLGLASNQLTGNIPFELANLTNLRQLDIDRNRLSGAIPTELGRLANLEGLRLSDNFLSGEMPSELGGLSKLGTLHLSGNRISGNIPPDLGRLSNLSSLELANNQLSGEIPSELGQLATLRTLRLRGNELEGEIPSELGRLENLWDLDLRDNQLSGPIPSELGGLPNLGRLFLGGNLLTGCIPRSLRDVAENDLHELGLPFCGGS